MQVTALYVQYQARMVEDRVRKLRTAIDGVNPDFQIGVYGWGSMSEALMRSVATARARVLDMTLKFRVGADQQAVKVVERGSVLKEK